MKKIIYILPLLFVAFFTACEVESGESGYPRTLQGKAVYDVVEGRLYQSVTLLDLMTKVDYYAQAPDADKEGIKNYYLSGYTITSDDDMWTLRNDDQIITFTHNRKSINEAGAIWTVKVTFKLWDGSTVAIVEDKNFRVESLGDMDWKLITSNLKYYSPVLGYSYPSEELSNSELSVKGFKAYEKSPNLYDFKFESGHGDIGLYLYSDRVNYEISEPMTYAYTTSGYSGLAFINGKVDITAGNDKIVGKIISSNYYSRIELTFNGVTELY